MKFIFNDKTVYVLEKILRILTSSIYLNETKDYIFCGLHTLSSFLTLAPHFLHLYFGFSLSSNFFFLQAVFPIKNFVVPDD